MNTELITETLRLEGEIFLLNRKIDKAVNVNEYVKDKKKVSEITTRLLQYRMMIDEFTKMEKLKSMKRRMMK